MVLMALPLKASPPLPQARVWAAWRRMCANGAPWHSFGIVHNTLNPRPLRFLPPWERSSECCYADGGNKFDLSKISEAYMTRVEDFLGAAQQRGMELKSESERHENRIEYNERRMNELDIQHANAESEIGGAQDRRKHVDAELESINQQLAGSGHALERARGRVSERGEALEAINTAMDRRRGSQQRTQVELDDSSTGLTNARNELNALEL